MQHQDPRIDAIIADDKVFDEEVPNLYHLEKLVEANPNNTEAIATRFFAKPRLNSFLTTDKDLETLLKLFPNRRQEIAKLLMASLKQPKSFTNFNYDLENLKSIQKLLILPRTFRHSHTAILH